MRQCHISSPGHGSHLFLRALLFLIISSLPWPGARLTSISTSRHVRADGDTNIGSLESSPDPTSQPRSGYSPDDVISDSREVSGLRKVTLSPNHGILGVTENATKLPEGIPTRIVWHYSKQKNA